jgi:1,4-dihydroxy-2-naphthoyl-CoA synthase
MIEIILLSVGAFALGYLSSYLVMTVGIKQDKE